MKKVCIFFGGASTEHDISVITAMQLAKNIKDRYEIEKIYIGLDNNFYLATNINDIKYFSDKSKIKLKRLIVIDNAIYLKGFCLKKYCEIFVAINCCHGGTGENGDLAGFFTVNKIRHIGCDALSAHICMDKSLTKELVSDIAPTIGGILVNKDNFLQSKNLIENELNDELIVKPNSLGSSIGVKACDKTNYAEQIEAIFLLNDNALVENRIVNMLEYNQACYRSKDKVVLSAIENPIKETEILSFDEKYMKSNKGKRTDRVIPAKITKKLKDTIDSYTTKIYKKLNLNGVVRIDYIYDIDNKILYFNEVNTIPGSMAFYLFEPIGIDYISLIDDLIDNAQPIKKFSYFNSSVLSNKLL